MTETVLVIGASGKIGVSVIMSARRTKRNVLAVVRNQAAQDKLLQHAGGSDGISFITADVTDPNGMQSVVDAVKAGKAPAFQHVYAAVGIIEWTQPIQNVTMEAYHRIMKTNVESNFCSYCATVPYLLEHGGPNATWTLITGGAGEHGLAGVTALSQGAMFSLANVACRENMATNVRFNEVYLCYQVDYDSIAEEKGLEQNIKASEFAQVYEKMLEDETIKGCRVSVYGRSDLDDLKVAKKLPHLDKND